MKKFLNILALVAVTAAFAAPAFADAYRIVTLPKMTWNKGATTDSTVIAVPAGFAVAAAADTTNWYDLGKFNFAQSVNGSSTASQIVSMQVNAQQAATLDTMRTTIQYSNDPAGGFTAASAVVLVGQTASTVAVADQDDTIYRFFRVIFDHYDGSTTTTRKVSIVPVIKVAQ